MNNKSVVICVPWYPSHVWPRHLPNQQAPCTEPETPMYEGVQDPLDHRRFWRASHLALHGQICRHLCSPFEACSQLLVCSEAVGQGCHIGQKSVLWYEWWYCWQSGNALLALQLEGELWGWWCNTLLLSFPVISTYIQCNNICLSPSTYGYKQVYTKSIITLGMFMHTLYINCTIQPTTQLTRCRVWQVPMWSTLWCGWTYSSCRTHVHSEYMYMTCNTLDNSTV